MIEEMFFQLKVSILDRIVFTLHGLHDLPIAKHVFRLIAKEFVMEKR